MKQQEFEQRYQSLWQQLEQTLDTKKDADLEQFPQQYRRVCHHLAIAKNRRYSPYLVDRLNHLVMKSHHRLYRHNARFNFQILRFLLFGFPQALRDNSRYVWSAIGLLFVPGLLMFLLCYANDEIIYSLMSPEQVRQYESMYDPSARALGEGEAAILADLAAAQGAPVDLGGYYHTDPARTEAAMRPSGTLNAIIG